ncbi:hypothetical protein ANTPLA_LOCUS3320 [Anthophora plagiata]
MKEVTKRNGSRRNGNRFHSLISTFVESISNNFQQISQKTNTSLLSLSNLKSPVRTSISIVDRTFILGFFSIYE